MCCDIPFGDANWNGEHDTESTKPKNLIITVNMELDTESTDFNTDNHN